MIKFRVESCNEEIFSNGKKFYKTSGIILGDDIEGGRQILSFYNSVPVSIDQTYGATLKSSSDLKALKINIGQPIFDKK